MRLDQSTWPEVEAYLARAAGIIIPCGSTEQHGPMGLIGTDAICAETVAVGAGRIADALVAPVVAYSPAPFNTAFPGTVSVSETTFAALLAEIVGGLAEQGFRDFYLLNGHGANAAPLSRLQAQFPALNLVVRAWWEFETVTALRDRYYGDWEGMHATPSEVAITQATVRVVPPGDAATPPRQLSPAYIRSHAGDRHGPPETHRRQFPDGRVGAHSALARPEHGAALLKAAIDAVALDYRAFAAGPG